MEILHNFLNTSHDDNIRGSLDSYNLHGLYPYGSRSLIVGQGKVYLVTKESNALILFYQHSTQTLYFNFYYYNFYNHYYAYLKRLDIKKFVIVMGDINEVLKESIVVNNLMEKKELIKDAKRCLQLIYEPHKVVPVPEETGISTKVPIAEEDFENLFN